MVAVVVAVVVILIAVHSIPANMAIGVHGMGHQLSFTANQTVGKLVTSLLLSIIFVPF